MPVIHPVDVLIVIDEPGDKGIAIGVLDDHDRASVGDGLVVSHGEGLVLAEGSVELALGVAGHVAGHWTVEPSALVMVQVLVPLGR